MKLFWNWWDRMQQEGVGYEKRRYVSIYYTITSTIFYCAPPSLIQPTKLDCFIHHLHKWAWNIPLFNIFYEIRLTTNGDAAKLFR